jgi:hypothetical protein
LIASFHILHGTVFNDLAPHHQVNEPACGMLNIMFQYKFARKLSLFGSSCLVLSAAG